MESTKSLSVRHQAIRNIEQLAKEAFANHQVTMRLDHGLFRSWRCSRPGSSVYAFDVTTIPGSLFVTGDIGDLIVSRTEDMIAWSRSSINSIGYFAEKVPHSIPTKAWSDDRCREWVRDEISDAPECCVDQDAADKRIEALKELLPYADEGEHFFSHRLYESGLEDGSDWPDLKVYDSNFFWCREAVRWLIARLDAQSATGK